MMPHCFDDLMLLNRVGRWYRQWLRLFPFIQNASCDLLARLPCGTLCFCFQNVSIALNSAQENVREEDHSFASNTDDAAARLENPLLIHMARDCHLEN